MIKNYDFKSSEWKSDFFYARAPHTKFNAKFKDSEDGILKNEYNGAISEEDYISLISKAKYTAGTEVKMTCAFSGTGAPCLVFTNEVEEGEDFPEYKLHFEVCVYKGGVNVWHIIPFPERIGRPIKPTKIYFEEWQVNSEGTECLVKFGEKKITVYIEGREFAVENEDFPSEFRVGFTACEGPCSFTGFSIKQGE